MSHGLSEVEECFIRALYRFQEGAGEGSHCDCWWKDTSTPEVIELFRKARHAFGDDLFDKLAAAYFQMHEQLLLEEIPK